jgi:hypothetical protein
MNEKNNITVLCFVKIFYCWFLINIKLCKLKANPIVILMKNTNCKYGGKLKLKRIYKKMGYIINKL